MLTTCNDKNPCNDYIKVKKPIAVFYFHVIYPITVLCVPLVFSTAVFLYSRSKTNCCVFSAGCILNTSNFTNNCIFKNHWYNYNFGLYSM